jgi:hypothetical protein
MTHLEKAKNVFDWFESKPKYFNHDGLVIDGMGGSPINIT